MPEGWVVDMEGNTIVDPARADEGYLMPIGGYKGSGLNLGLGLLAGVLNGAAFGEDVIDHRRVPGQAANTGQAIFVVRPDLFRDPADFISDMERHLQALRASGPEGSVHIPGDVAAAEVQARLNGGIPLGEVLVGQLRELGTRLGLEDRLD